MTLIPDLLPLIRFMQNLSIVKIRMIRILDLEVLSRSYPQFP